MAAKLKTSCWTDWGTTKVAINARSTSDSFVHGGVDTPITRANIKAVQEARAKKDKPALSADQVVNLFVSKPTKRHFERAYKLFAPKPQAQKASA